MQAVCGCVSVLVVNYTLETHDVLETQRPQRSALLSTLLHITASKVDPQFLLLIMAIVFLFLVIIIVLYSII